MQRSATWPERDDRPHRNINRMILLVNADNLKDGALLVVQIPLKTVASACPTQVRTPVLANA